MEQRSRGRPADEKQSLLNRGLDTKYVVCPSQAFAPVNRLKDKKMIMPQQGAMCEEDNINCCRGGFRVTTKTFGESLNTKPAQVITKGI
ncbi:MAG: hypothetical protein F6K14_03625 [Symploca sp. SIO2C1]|nr:hypothetical protein [Symploca sp. SIO2C1]